MTVNQYEVDQTNFSGRLHPSQRVVAFPGMVMGALLIVVAVVLLVLALTGGVGGANLLWLLPAVVLLVWGLWLIVRRARELSGGVVTATTGWSGAEVPLKTKPYRTVEEFGKTIALSNGQQSYRVKIGDQRFTVDKKLYDRVSTNCTNTAFHTPRTKKLVNIARTPGR